MANPIKKCVLHGAVNNETVTLYPRTNLASVEDMTAFARTLNGAADAAAARNTLEITTQAALINIIYPVGSVITLTNDTAPNELYQGTTWVKMDAGRVLVSAGTYTEGSDTYTYTYTLGDKGGEAKHQNTLEEMPPHEHKASASSTGGHNHLLFKKEFANFDNANTNITANTSVAAGTHSSRGEAYAMIAGSSAANSGLSSWTGGASPSVSISNAGSGVKVNNLQPYEVVNYWKRTN